MTDGEFRNTSKRGFEIPFCNSRAILCQFRAILPKSARYFEAAFRGTFRHAARQLLTTLPWFFGPTSRQRGELRESSASAALQRFCGWTPGLDTLQKPIGHLPDSHWTAHWTLFGHL
jgi:hypothetical protein